MSRSLPLAIVAGVLLSACLEAEGGLHVEVDGPLVKDRDFNRLDIEVHTLAGELLASEAFERETLKPLPVSVNFVSGQKTRAGAEVRVTALAKLGMRVVSRTSGDATLKTGEGESLALWLPPVGDSPDASSPDAGQPDGGQNDGGLLPLGSSCAQGSQCASDHCVDGVCCDSACPDACDACDLPASPGRCALRAAGSAGSPSCRPYGCDGTSPTCAQSCVAPSVGCEAGYPCSSTGVCMLPLAELQDAFDGTSLDTTRWSPATCCGGAATVAQRNAQLEFSIVALDAGYAAIRSRVPYFAQSSSAILEVKNAGDQSLAGLDFAWGLQQSLANVVFFRLSQNTLQAMTRVDGGNTLVSTASYSSASMRYLRLREDGGTTYWETSPDRSSWSPLASRLNPIPMNEVYAQIQAGTWQAAPTPTLVIIDNFNAP